MSKTIEAVYEHGVLHLMEPLSLPEGTQVEVTVTLKASASATRTPADILAEIAALTPPVDTTEYSSRDHDKILYGEHGEA